MTTAASPIPRFQRQQSRRLNLWLKTWLSENNHPVWKARDHRLTVVWAMDQQGQGLPEWRLTWSKSRLNTRSFNEGGSHRRLPIETIGYHDLQHWVKSLPGINLDHTPWDVLSLGLAWFQSREKHHAGMLEELARRLSFCRKDEAVFAQRVQRRALRAERGPCVPRVVRQPGEPLWNPSAHRKPLSIASNNLKEISPC